MNALQVVASTGEPAFAVNHEGEVIAWNDAARNCFGYRRTEALGRPCWELLRGEDFFGNRYCNANCPLRDLAPRGRPINSTKMYFRVATGERRLVRLCLLVVPGAAPPGPAIIHLVETLPVRHELDRPGPSRLGRGKISARLTKREVEVLGHLGHGKGTREIAENLCISSSTVRHHIQNIFRKLKVHGRLEAVTLAQRIGLI